MLLMLLWYKSHHFNYSTEFILACLLHQMHLSLNCPYISLTTDHKNKADALRYRCRLIRLGLSCRSDLVLSSCSTMLIFQKKNERRSWPPALATDFAISHLQLQRTFGKLDSHRHRHVWKEVNWSSCDLIVKLCQCRASIFQLVGTDLIPEPVVACL